VTSANNPIDAGPIKKAPRLITPTLPIATDGAIPGTELAARMKAGNIGPIPRPAQIKPRLITIRELIRE
jgi:hypothetical protein